MKLRQLLLPVCLLFLARLSFAQEISVAAAADLQFAFHDVAARFEKDTHHAVKLTFGSSGNFFAQIQNGAPFDLFFSADLDYAKKLEAAGLTEPGTFYEYAQGKIVLWAPQDSRLDLKQGLKALLDPNVKKISIANPRHAPYGRAAVAAMQKEGIYDQVSGKLVMGENISQAASFVASGNADVGIIALSLALGPSMKEKGRYESISDDDYPAIQQAAVVLKTSAQKDVARQFLEYLKRPEIAQIMIDYGFSVPQSGR